MVPGDEPRGHFGHWGSCCESQTTAGKGCEGRSLQQPRKQPSCGRTAGREAPGAPAWPLLELAGTLQGCICDFPHLALPASAGPPLAALLVLPRSSGGHGVLGAPHDLLLLRRVPEKRVLIPGAEEDPSEDPLQASVALRWLHPGNLLSSLLAPLSLSPQPLHLFSLCILDF